MNRGQQIEEITRLANAIWGSDTTGQVIVGRECVRVFAVTGNRSLFELEQPHAFELACKTLKARAGEGVPVAGTKEKAPSKDGGSRPKRLRSRRPRPADRA